MVVKRKQKTVLGYVAGYTVMPMDAFHSNRLLRKWRWSYLIHGERFKNCRTEPTDIDYINCPGPPLATTTLSEGGAIIAFLGRSARIQFNKSLYRTLWLQQGP